MSDTVYPTIDDINLKVTREQAYDTRSQTESGGRDLGLGARSQARYLWTLDYGYLTETNVTALSAFIHSMGGRKDTFLFSDPLLPSATLWTFRDGIGTGTLRTVGNGALTSFYLCDPNGDPIAKHAGGTTYYVDGVIDYGATPSTADGAAKITFSSTPGVGESIAWSYGYYRRCKFTEDALSVSRIVTGKYNARVQIISQTLP